ncbi:MAG TPA: hypothetical protein VJJ83_05410, partial [Candidatus Babeliales bacterium]|nr:hypothetical protein [Candidatus Babeliales bacterium]
IDPTAYATNTGHQLQQVLQQECVDLLSQTAGITPLSPLYQHQRALTELIDAAHSYSQTGALHEAVQVNDLCWSLLEYGQAAVSGAAQGLNAVAHEAVTHPLETLAYAAAGEYLLAYQLAKVVHDLAGIGITAMHDPAQARAQWQDYIAPLEQTITALQQQSRTTADLIKASTSLAVTWHAQNRLLGGLKKFYGATKTNALQFAKQHPQIAPQQYLATAEGQVLKAVTESAVTPKRFTKPPVNSIVNQSPVAILKNGYYEVNGFKFTEYYYNRLWDNGRHYPSLITREVLESATEILPDRVPGFFKYTCGKWTLVYNPITKEVHHLQPNHKLQRVKL